MPSSFELRQRSLDLLREWTAIPSVTGDTENLHRMAAALAAHLRDRLGAEIIGDCMRTDPPIVHARIDRGAASTILLYNMYDVMPADPAGWSVPPFIGGITDLPGLGPCYVARGAENNKGPLAGMLVALAALLDADALAANVEILIEGQEESGSHVLRHYLLDSETPVRHCAAALFPSFCEYGGGPPRLYLGSKGIAHGWVRVAGGAWGGPAAPIHSSNAPWIANPAWQLVTALACVQDASATGTLGRIALPDDARPILAKLATEFDPQAELAFRRTERYAIGGDAAARLEAVLTATSLNLSSLATRPANSRAVIPPAAQAHFDLRVPPGVDPRAVLALLAATLAGNAAELQTDDAYPGHRFPAAHPAVAALTETYRRAGATPQIWPWAIGAMPAYAFAAMSTCFLIGGLGRGGNAHGIDEFVTLDGLDRFLASLLAWLPATAAAVSTTSSFPGAMP